MKTHLKQLIRTSLKGMAVAAMLVAGSVQTSQAGTADPSGGGTFTWDLLSAGSGQRGIALITFSNNQSTAVPSGTFRGYQMLAANPPKTNNNNNNGGRGENSGRGDSGGGSLAGKTNHFLFGFSPINGFWTENSRGQVVGFFTEVINVTSLVTNFLAGSFSTNIVNSLNTAETTPIAISFTNGQQTLITNHDWATPIPHTDQYTIANPNITVAVGSAESTNNVSFTGKATGKRLNLVCSTSFGQVTYKGIPAPAADSLSLASNWIGSKRVGGVQGNVFFSLTSFQDANPFPVDFPDIASFHNLYFTTDGVEAEGGFSGVALFSQKKTMGFVFFKDDGSISASIGTLKVNKHGATATTTGIQEPFSQLNFTATEQ